MTMALVLLLLLGLSAASAAPARHVCDPKRFSNLGLNIDHFPYCDTSLTFTQRAKHLVDSMTLHEKATNLGNHAAGVKRLGNHAAGVKRLGIPPYNWWSEALHGVSNVGHGSNFTKQVPGATSFPTPINSGAAFNQSLWKAIGQAVSTEARAMHNLGIAGLTFWSPNINVVRDPRWGRTLETPGEDPYAVGVYAVNFVRGLQDVKGYEVTEDLDTRPLKVSACCKHYAAYDVDHWWGPGNALTDRLSFNANVTEQDMVETFQRPFEMCVKEGDVSSVMCSYNNVNGIPACTDARLLRGTIRGDWNLHGYIVSDCDSVEVIVDNQKFIQDTPEDSVAQTLRAGLDLDCGDFYPNYLESAVLNKGLVKESDIDNALINNYIVLLRLGYFDNNPVFESLGASSVCTDEHLKLAADAARQGIVLLKGNGLPLNISSIKNIAVVGPHANATSVMIGNYEGIPCRYISPLDGFSKYAKVNYKMGCANVACKNDTLIFNAVKAAKAADATVIVVGLNRGFEEEGRDRSDIELPGFQNLLIKQVSSQAKGPVVLVILSAGGVNIAPYVQSNDIDGIVWAGYPGQEGGQAIADVVFGKYNPGGRLPVTWYTPDYVSKLPMTSMKLRPIDEVGYPGRTYKFYNGSTIYPFGYGLSYTQFSYNVISTEKSLHKTLSSTQHCLILHYNQSAYIPPCHAAQVDHLSCDEDITLQVEVSNTGKLGGSDVVMVYTRAPKGIIGTPIKQLVAFQRVNVAAGSSEIVTFKLSSCKALSIVTDSAYVALPEGEHRIVVGNGKNAIEFPFHVKLRK